MENAGRRNLLCLLLIPALVGCAGVLQDEAAKAPEPPVPREIAAPAAPIPDEAETVRLQGKEMLLGKWRRDAPGGDTIEFLDDGTVNFFSAVEKRAYPGSYRVLDKDKLEIVMKSGAPLTWGYAVTRGELTLTTPTGVGMKYKRSRGK
ncbi:MAG: hypothetical protein A4E67_00925 [Syntrophaceae bacterium PtaB.Bin038]|jgi:hypothetical protein|nr:MAG: hypothetical protein A4E67_00925 [Syntrophaceae bacterium PtaB.Bin038]